jgi:hypothetical protein
MASKKTARQKPLVFLSANRDDYRWRDRLKRSLGNTNLGVDWWDDSRIPSGSDLQKEINSAIQRASVAVILLSPTYISSATAQKELDSLAKRHRDGRLKLFPIVIQSCSWSGLPISQVQLWNMGKPLVDLDEETLHQELEKIAESIAELARNASSPKESVAADESEYRFSKTATMVLERAQSLARDTGRVGVTSSCILFAFAESAREQEDTSRLVRDVLDRTGKYRDAYAVFIKDSDRSPAQSAKNVGGFLGSVSANVEAMLKSGADFAHRVSGGSREIHQRHLLAALLTTSEDDKRPVARRRLEDMGLSIFVFRQALRDFIASHASGDNQREWDSILNATAKEISAEHPDAETGFVSGPAGYTSEFCGVGGSNPVPDHLGVDGLAHRLADLIALRETRLPLAVGLFGNWGSGKSHFMNLMDRHLKRRAQEKAEDWSRYATEPGISVRPDSTDEGPWCREIVPIYFNAWHYHDANLWASLVTEIFEGLSMHLAPKAGSLKLMLARLREAGGATARAEEEAVVAREEVRKAGVMLQEARMRSEGARQAIEGLMDNLKTLVPQLNTPENQRRVVEWLGVSAEVATLSELVAKHREMGSLPGQFHELLHRATAREGLAGRLGWLFGALIVLPGLAWLGATLVPQIAAWLKEISPAIKTAVTLLVGAVAWTIPVIAQIRQRLRQMETWQTQAEQAQAALPKDERVIAAQETVVQAAATATVAETNLVGPSARAGALEGCRRLAARTTPQPVCRSTCPVFGLSRPTWFGESRAAGLSGVERHFCRRRQAQRKGQSSVGRGIRQP